MTFYLQLYDIRHKVKDHSNSKRGNMLQPLHGLLFYMHYPMAFVTPVIEHWLEWVHHQESIQRPITPWADTLPQSYTLLFTNIESVVEQPLMVQWVFGLIPHDGLIELFLVPANAPQ